MCMNISAFKSLIFFTLFHHQNTNSELIETDSSFIRHEAIKLIFLLLMLNNTWGGGRFYDIITQ